MKDEQDKTYFGRSDQNIEVLSDATGVVPTLKLSDRLKADIYGPRNPARGLIAKDIRVLGGVDEGMLGVAVYRDSLVIVHVSL